MLDSQFGEAKQSKAAKNWLLAFESDIQTQAQMQLFHRCNFAYKHKQMYCGSAQSHSDTHILGSGLMCMFCYACVRTEREEIKAALSVCLQPTLLKRIA